MGLNIPIEGEKDLVIEIGDKFYLKQAGWIKNYLIHILAIVDKYQIVYKRYSPIKKRWFYYVESGWIFQMYRERKILRLKNEGGDYGKNV